MDRLISRLHAFVIKRPRLKSFLKKLIALYNHTPSKAATYKSSHIERIRQEIELARGES